MVKKAIITYECDNCGGVELPDEDVTMANPLPKAWVDLTAKSNDGYLFELQLCVGCLMAIGAAMNERRKEGHVSEDNVV